MTTARYSRQERLPEVGPLGQARLAALEVTIPDSNAAEIEREYLLRAGVRSVRIGDGSEGPFPHAAHFHTAASRRFAEGAWRALAELRAALVLPGSG